MLVRSYGSSGPLVIVVHGGPGAAGSMAPVARGLADSFRVLEPFQRPGAATVADHVEDLHELVESSGEPRPAIVGHSWGAMLTLAYAAAHPNTVGRLVLVSSGTFDVAARAEFGAILKQRMDSGMRERFKHLDKEFSDSNERFAAMGKLTLQLYSYDLATTEVENEPGDTSAGADTWNDMVRLQEEGVYPSAFAAIKSAVLMLHGADDPHPGAMIRASLEPYLPQLEYWEWRRCGHYPWMEKFVRDDFLLRLRDWLAARFA